MPHSNFICNNEISGRWNKNRYHILQFIGQGGIGAVYKVKDLNTGDIWALKISNDLQSITKEYKMLEKFQYMRCIPKVKEMDDFILGDSYFHYIIMEYIEGSTLKAYVQNKSINFLSALGLILIIGKCFLEIHNNQLVFGDLKLENLMIDNHNHLLKIIDLGSVTPIGFSIKEFTPLYDRASWNMGIRTADAQYDLFALNMLLVAILLREEIGPGYNTIQNLIDKLKAKKIPLSLICLIKKGLMQSSITFESFLKHLDKIYKKESSKPKEIEVNNIEQLINRIFISSMLLFIGILSILLGKSICF